MSSRKRMSLNKTWLIKKETLLKRYSYYQYQYKDYQISYLYKKSKFLYTNINSNQKHWWRACIIELRNLRDRIQALTGQKEAGKYSQNTSEDQLRLAYICYGPENPTTRSHIYPGNYFLIFPQCMIRDTFFWSHTVPTVMGSFFVYFLSKIPLRLRGIFYSWWYPLPRIISWLLYICSRRMRSASECGMTKSEILISLWGISERSSRSIP